MRTEFWSGKRVRKKFRRSKMRWEGNIKMGEGDML
jgi:hypothetical protein